MGIFGLSLVRHLMLIDKLSGCTCAAFALEGGECDLLFLWRI